MEKRIVFAFIALLTLISCEKVSLPENTKGDEPEGNLITRTTPSNACTRINYAIYDLDGTRIKQVNQQLDDAHFGTASFQLGKGDYYMVVVAHSSNGNPTMTDPTCIKFTNAQGYSDTFLCSGPITISDEPLDMSLTLERIVALCRFVITDDYPANVTKMKFYYTGGSGAFDAYTGLGSVNSKQTMIFDISDGSKQFDLYTFLHDIEGIIHLTVTALDDDDNILHERLFDVPLYQNHLTWLSGAYFVGSGSSTATVSGINIHTDWAAEHHINF